MGSVVVVGAGMGGLAAAVAARQAGHDVTVFEARDRPGGLASGLEIEGLRFDAGPYVLLDRPGLEWAYDRLGVDLGSLGLERIEDVYRVDLGGQHAVRVHDDLERTAAGIDREWPGGGRAYREFVEGLVGTHERTRQLQWVPDPGVLDVLRTGAWRDVPFLLRSLRGVLDRADLPEPVERAVAIWTYVAGQTVEDAPSVLAMVPTLVHHVGAYYPEGGIETLPGALADRAGSLGVEIEYDTRVERIRTARNRQSSTKWRPTTLTGRDRTVTGVTLADGREVSADAVVSNYSGVGTYLELLDGDLPDRTTRRLRELPLQSPGVCGYLRVRGEPEPPYLRFRLGEEGGPCRLFVQPGVVEPDCAREGWYPARFVAPLDYDRATSTDRETQRAILEEYLAEPWWQSAVEDWELLSARTVEDWGSEFHLYEHSMNPVMTAEFMREGRMAHRTPHVEGLYLAGSSTHPGQWVSFCAVSGIHAADLLDGDL